MTTNQNAALETSTPWQTRAHIMLHAGLFVLGFSLVFIIGWGGATTLLGGLFITYKQWIARIGGAVLIFFGLATMDVIRVGWFNMDTRPQFQGKTGTWWSSLAMGLFFAAGWSPCIAAPLAAILNLSFSQDTVGLAMLLSSGYALGMGIPFLLMALALDRAIGWVRRLRRYMPMFKVVSGVLIIVIGLLMVTDQMTMIARWATNAGLYLDPLAGTANQPGYTPSYLVAILAGLLSFLSPCVLPLVPAYLGYLSGQALRAPGHAGA